MVTAADWTNAQASVIGSALIDGSCAPLLMSELRPEDLTGTYRTLYEAIVDLKLRGQAVDPVTVLNAVGPAYRDEVVRLIDVTPTAANVAAYIGVCKEQSRLSRLAALGMELAGAVTLDAARETLQRAQAVAVEQVGGRSVTMQDALTDFYERHQHGAQQYISLGLRELDEKLTLSRGDVFVLGGYPSDGKTALMLQWVWQIAEKMPVGIFSFETRADKLADRLITQAVPALKFSDVKHSTMSMESWKAVTAESVRITRRSIQIVEAAGMTAADVLGVTLSRGFQAIALDYVQLVAPGVQRRGGTRAEEVAEVSKALALMARRHGLLVIELSQLTRPPKNAKGKTPPPTLSSLRESGQLEQDADVVALLYRLGEAEEAHRELFVAKNKEGRIGRMELAFDGEGQRFRYIARGDAAVTALEKMQKKRHAEKYGGDQTELQM